MDTRFFFYIPEIAPAPARSPNVIPVPIGSIHVPPKLLMRPTSWFSCGNGWRVDFRYIRGDHLNHPPPTIKIKSIAMTHPAANDEARWGRERIYQAKSGEYIFSPIETYRVAIINEHRLGSGEGMGMRGKVNDNTQQPYTKLIINLDANAPGHFVNVSFEVEFRKIEAEPKSRRLRFRVFTIDTFDIAPFPLPPRYNAIANIDDTACRYISWSVNIARQLLLLCIFHPYRHLVRRVSCKKYIQKRQSCGT